MEIVAIMIYVIVGYLLIISHIRAWRDNRTRTEENFVVRKRLLVIWGMAIASLLLTPFMFLIGPWPDFGFWDQGGPVFIVLLVFPLGMVLAMFAFVRFKIEVNGDTIRYTPAGLGRKSALSFSDVTKAVRYRDNTYNLVLYSKEKPVLILFEGSCGITSFIYFILKLYCEKLLDLDDATHAIVQRGGKASDERIFRTSQWLSENRTSRKKQRKKRNFDRCENLCDY